MGLLLTEEQKAVQRMVREFAEKEIAPTWAEYDEAEKFPWENIRKAAELNLLGSLIPEQYGGAGLDACTWVLAMEELARVSPSDAGIIYTHDGVADSILHFGTEEQKQRFVVPLARGEKVAALCLTEPNAGSDLSAIETTADRDGDDYILNGNKIFTSSGGEAQVYLVLAKTDKTKGTKGMSMFILESGMPGFTFGKKEKKLANKACVAREEIFENCRVPKENMLGAEGRGFGIAMAGLDIARVGTAATAVGIAQGAFEAAVNYDKERVQFGQTIASFQGIQWMIADMATQIEAARLLTQNAARLRDAGQNYTMEASMAKVFATDVAMKVATDCVQLLGGVGLMREYPVEHFFRDAKQYQIVEGTNQVQKIIIARHILA